MKYSTFFITLTTICILGGFSYVVFIGFTTYKTGSHTDAEIVGPIFQPPVSKRPDGFLEYKNLLYGFTLYYPDDLRVLEYDDGTSASTITFEDPSNEKGFQIFIVPYAEDHIIPEQFKKDTPSGVMKEPVDVIIGGVPATIFFSVNPAMGETREVWFIRSGFLYEVTTYKDLDSWLAEIMQTWVFLP